MSQADQKVKTRAMANAAKVWEKSPTDQNLKEFLRCKADAGVSLSKDGIIGKKLQMKLKTAITAYEKKTTAQTTQTTTPAKQPAAVLA